MPMCDSNLQHSLQARAGGLFVLVEGMGINVQRSRGLAMTEDAATVATSVPPATVIGEAHHVPHLNF